MADMLNSLGLECNRDEATEQARRYFIAAHQLVPQEPRYLLSAANMHLKLGDAPSAIALYEKLRGMTLTQKQANMVCYSHVVASSPEQRSGPRYSLNCISCGASRKQAGDDAIHSW